MAVRLVLAVVLVAIAVSACGDSGVKDAFCADWEIVVDSMLEAEEYLVNGAGQESAEAFEAMSAATARLREMEWPADVSDAVEAYFAILDSGGPNFFLPSIRTGRTRRALSMPIW